VIAECGGSSTERRATGTSVVPGTVATNRAPPPVVTLGEAIVDTAEPGCKCRTGVAVFADRLRSVG
jgi:hypothetical protein